MLKTSILFFIFLIVTNINAQAPQNSDDCAKKKYLYFEHLKSGNYKEARLLWLEAENTCGGLENQDERFFINGKAIYNGLKKETSAKDSLLIQQYNDTIGLIYQKGWEIHQNKLWALSYAQHLFYVTKDYAESEIEALFENVHRLKEKTPAVHLSNYVKYWVIHKYNKAESSDRKEIALKVFNDYFKLDEYCGLAIEQLSTVETAQKKIKKYEKVQALLDACLVQLPVSKDQINDKFMAQFTDLPTDDQSKIKKLEHGMYLLEKLDATQEEVYKTYVYEYLTIHPTPKGFLKVGNIELKALNNQAALTAYEKALELGPTQKDEAEINYYKAIALYQQRAYKKSFKTAKLVKVSLEGKALKLCGDCILALSETCGNSTFERKANYWLVNDYYRKAADKGEKVNKASFSKMWPTNGDVFNEGLNMGDKYLLKCWNESTIIR